ncbi:hypothetical protein [Actinoallomurus rhizosphaericola]|uniref:hypothetical protein n=1 Tax=Actinoallomurus rhizosphaericola TaxID=2952536 RepID=UPI002093F103|nr:hypothetical protein [Actinoallomurus rhizosphaericola]MCO6000176.1 hypothetical protein [Actinoallomurus rhizosphaericola]
MNTMVRPPAPTDEEDGVRGNGLFVRSDAQRLPHLVTRIDRGELRVEVTRRMPPVTLHADAVAGKDAPPPQLSEEELAGRRRRAAESASAYRSELLQRAEPASPANGRP